MSYDRIIQDSDDEDDPLCEVPANLCSHKPQLQDAFPRDSQQENGAISGNISHAINGYELGNDISFPDSMDEINHLANSQLGVNFDEFLKPQDDAQAWLSSSQQRREERWIPNAAKTESISASSKSYFCLSPPSHMML